MSHNITDIMLHALTERLVKHLYAEHGIHGLAFLSANVVYELAEIDPEMARAALKHGREMLNTMLADGVAVEVEDRGTPN